ncbi:MAG: beta-galactosidase [Ruminococcaceae bacterium]|nr:beta-galactosidase [Oscillospiraceae bacterium]
MSIPRPEHPKPQWRRDSWMNLNGEWQFEIDNARSGEARGLQNESVPLSGTITVPFCPESTLSGIGHTDFMRGVWYKRTVTLPAIDNQTRLHIGAADYRCRVYVNGSFVGEHKGGYASFFTDITDALREGENEIALYIEDDTQDRSIPSGKQCATYHSWGCYYTRTTGVWQTVWLEFLPDTHVEQAHFVTNVADNSVTVMAQLIGRADFACDITLDGKPMGHYTALAVSGNITFTVPLAEQHLWDIGKGNLYEVVFTFGDDSVHSYFGLRDIAFDGKRFLLNGRLVFQRLVLDQGFYPDGIYTAPTDDALRRDIELSMALGFNGARLHEKVFEERFLYYADSMGYLVWGEYPDWGLDHSKPENLAPIMNEWLEVVKRDRNHPSIVGWCPRNETWDQDHRKQWDEGVALLYEMTKALDPTRPCIDASGNYHVKTDVFCLHDYSQDPATLREHYAPLAEGGVPFDPYAERQVYADEPIMISEYGGIAWDLNASGWGYGEGPKTLEEFYERFEGLTNALLDNPALFGFCYTQLTNVEQEQNGLYTYDRQPKFDAKRIHTVISRKAAIEE